MAELPQAPNLFFEIIKDDPQGIHEATKIATDIKKGLHISEAAKQKVVYWVLVYNKNVSKEEATRRVYDAKYAEQYFLQNRTRWETFACADFCRHCIDMVFLPFYQKYCDNLKKMF